MAAADSGQMRLQREMAGFRRTAKTSARENVAPGRPEAPVRERNGNRLAHTRQGMGGTGGVAGK